MSESGPAHQSPGAARGIIVHSGQGQTLSGPETIVLKLTAAETGGSIGVLEGTNSPGTGPPRHIHRSCDELFYVLEGKFLFLAGDRLEEGEPGTLVFVPRGTVHAVKAIGSEPGRLLVAYIPGGQEGAFEEFRRLPADVVAEKYDSEFVGPPL